MNNVTRRIFDTYRNAYTNTYDSFNISFNEHIYSRWIRRNGALQRTRDTINNRLRYSGKLYITKCSCLCVRSIHGDPRI